MSDLKAYNFFLNGVYIALIAMTLKLFISESSYYVSDDYLMLYSVVEIFVNFLIVGLIVYFFGLTILAVSNLGFKRETGRLSMIGICASASGILYVVLNLAPARIHWVIHQREFREAISKIPQNNDSLKLDILATKRNVDAPFLPGALDNYVSRSVLIFDDSDQIARTVRSAEWMSAMRRKSSLIANPQCHSIVKRIDLHVYAVDVFC